MERCEYCKQVHESLSEFDCSACGRTFCDAQVYRDEATLALRHRQVGGRACAPQDVQELEWQ